MDSIKELFDAFSQRIRSPFFGYIAIAFVASNWKPLAFLIFGDVPIAERIAHFDTETTYRTLAVYPIVAGIIAAVASPWFSYFGAWLAKKPVTLRKTLEVRAASEVARLRSELRESANKEVDELIQSALKQDAQLRKIENEQLRDELQKQISASRDVNSRNNSFFSDDSGARSHNSNPGKSSKKIQLLQSLAENARQMGKYEEASALLREALALEEASRN
ncbi:MAG TPA: hypothetical protein PLJ34_03630 [Hyphomicrobiales bacterium]|nr:hypothetical protein [Hyphomicrobiales bacterium]